MREVLGAGRGVQAGEVEIPAMAAEQQRREERRGREQRATRRATDATGHKIATHTKPQGFIIRSPLLHVTTNKVLSKLAQLAARRRAVVNAIS
jgi:hypothetical protein